MSFQPFINYTGYEHILMAGACFVHPKNGNVYFTACEQQQGVHQNLSVYRIVGGSNTPELVRRYLGTVDSQAQITYGSAVIGQGGALLVATSLIIPGVPKVTKTGFQGCWIREPNVDEPWSLSAIEESLSSIEDRMVAIETALGNLTSGGLDAADREALDRLRVLLRL